LLAICPLRSWATPQLGDEEWMRRFRAFVKLFNAFVESLNDGKFDLSTWRRMRSAWMQLDDAQ
jgi:CRISPR/Cas system-associated exonuclease Cas4 (RecB family)